MVLLHCIWAMCVRLTFLQTTLNFALFLNLH